LTFLRHFDDALNLATLYDLHRCCLDVSFNPTCFRDFEPLPGEDISSNLTWISASTLPAPLTTTSPCASIVPITLPSTVMLWSVWMDPLKVVCGPIKVFIAELAPFPPLNMFDTPFSSCTAESPS
jgi:hypothetical protein